MNRHLFITVLISILLIATLTNTIVVLVTKPSDTSTNMTCLTPGCVYAAALVLEAMNQTVKPCDDFYEFACGGFEKSTTIPDHRTGVSVFTMLKDKLHEQLRTSIEEPNDPGEPRPFRIAKNLYKTCMNASTIEETGLEPLRSILKELGGWPVVEGDNWKNDTFGFYKSIKKCWDLGFPRSLVLSSNNVESKNSMKSFIQNLQLNPYEASLPRDYLIDGLKNEIVKAYFDYMVDIAVALGANAQRAAEELKDSLEFEMKLANDSWSAEVRTRLDLLNATMAVSKIEKLYAHYRRKTIENTPKRSLANYIGWRVVQASIQYLTNDLRAREMGYLTMLNGQKARQARWKECVDIVSESMPVSMGALYVRDHFNIDRKENAKGMMKDIRVALMEILLQAEWMDNGTRTRALEKVAAMGASIAFPEELRNDTKLDEYYASLTELTTDNLLATVLNLRAFETQNLLGYLSNSTNETKGISFSRSATVNAFYILTKNSLQIPAALLQEKFFNDDRPQYMNYGAIGFVVGHEMTHGFDNDGSSFDKEGLSKNWWNSETKEKYSKKTRCMIHQYDNYTAESVGLKLNGFKTLGENIADNGGVKEAYLAYKNWAEKNGPEPTLPGLDYTPEQMFWISAANVWCSRDRSEALKLQIMQNVHSPGRFRVIGPFSNNPDFSADFKCPLGSTMNPIDKCSVW